MKEKITIHNIAAFFTVSFFFPFFATVHLCHCGSEQTFTTVQTGFGDLLCELPKRRRQIYEWPLEIWFIHIALLWIMHLKKLGIRILQILRMWSLFSSIYVYVCPFFISFSFFRLFVFSVCSVCSSCHLYRLFNIRVIIIFMMSGVPRIFSYFKKAHWTLFRFRMDLFGAAHEWGWPKRPPN